MSQVGTTALWLPALSTTDGTEVRTDADGWVSLTSGTTYVFALRVSDQNVESFSVACDAAIAFSGLTIETTNAPRQSSRPDNWRHRHRLGQHDRDDVGPRKPADRVHPDDGHWLDFDGGDAGEDRRTRRRGDPAE
jgi:hypothetical protein